MQDTITLVDELKPIAQILVEEQMSMTQQDEEQEVTRKIQTEE